MKRPPLLFIASALVLTTGCPTRESGGSGQQVDGSELARVTADLDGDGAQDVFSLSERMASVGSTKLEVDYSFEPETDSRIGAKLIDIDENDKMKEVLIIESDDLDGASYTVFTYDGKKIAESESLWMMQDPKIGGGSFITTDENCGEKTVVTYALAAGKLTKKDEKKTGTFDEAMCAACPYVFVTTSEGVAYEGEILRNLRSDELEGLQSLPLRRIESDGPVLVRLSEHKPEIAFIDHVYLTVNGVRVPEASCVMSGVEPWCTADGRYERLRRGQSVDLVFETPARGPNARVTLWARGYYESL